ncbi:MAG: LysM peptidoglycan-binding domain-containing protein [Anaerolineae bacterium]|nr:LysM peptidoglycan-binding domain-containing protein [Anaerolineae bacterium]
MRRRDRQSEILVALVVTVAMAFALAFGILLSLGDESTEDNDTATETLIATQRTATVEIAGVPDQAQTPEATEQPIEETEEVTPSEPPTEETVPSETPTEEVLLETEEALLETEEVVPSETPTEEALLETEEVVPSETPGEQALVETEAVTETPTKATQTPTNTKRPTETKTPTVTLTNTPTATPTATQTDTPTPTHTFSPTVTPSFTPTLTPTRQILFPVTFTPTIATDTPTPTLTTIALVTALVPTGTSLPPTPVCVQPTGWQVYIVQAGDTFFSLARQFEVDMDELAAANCLTDTDRIYAGQPLLVPPDVFNPADAAMQKCDTPYAQITYPLPGQGLEGFVTLRGIATGPDFRRYVIDWRPDDPTVTYRSFAEEFDNKPEESDLAVFNTDAFDPGLYWFNLFVLDSQDKLIGDCAIRVRFK